MLSTADGLKFDEVDSADFGAQLPNANTKAGNMKRE
jgi:hypothetical protein